jgi:hypothetical protein
MKKIFLGQKDMQSFFKIIILAHYILFAPILDILETPHWGLKFYGSKFVTFEPRVWGILNFE